MLLAVDVGNTQTVLGVFDGEHRVADWRIGTRSAITSDEFGVLLRALFTESGLEFRSVEGMIVSSVVPDVNRMLEETAARCLKVQPLFIEPGVRTGMPILYDNPHEVGADRIVNAVAAIQRYGAPVVVLDFGTATTFDVVDDDGKYLGGVISPGLGVSAEALFSKAARLHRVDIVRPQRVVGRNTEESMQSGLFHGYAALVRGVLERILDELDSEPAIVATGGLAQVFAKELPMLDAVDPGLTLEGLRLIWAKNRR